MKFLTISEAMKKGKGKVAVRGWIYRERGSNKFKFIVLRDSTEMIQCVLKREKFKKQWDDIDKLLIESSVEIEGSIKKDKRAPTGYEIEADKIRIVGKSEVFPIQKDLNEELLGDRRHLWLRSQKMTAGFYRFDTPVLQPTQSEGGSTVFQVNYYGQKVYLAQTWQLYGEAAIFALEKVYNFGPTFRAEKSKTSRHLSEFWMAETEVAWWKLDEITDFAKKEIKYCIEKVAKECSEEFRQLGVDSKEIIKIAKKPWPTIKYRKALQILKEKDGMKIPFGKDLRTIEEEKLMQHFDTPVVVTHYPRKVMAFYKPKDPKNPDEALCFDMLAPKCGLEIVGGSERSLDIKEMSENLKRDGENPKDYGFYFDLRKYGSVPHSGYGVGIERVLQWICKLDSIKDTIGFPRTMTRWSP
jgi:asparaginyl-tRNA synthetase